MHQKLIQHSESTILQLKKKKMQCLKDTVSNGYIAGLKDEDEEFRRSIVVTEAYCECV